MAIQDSMRTTRLHFMTLRGLLYDIRWLANFTESSSWSRPCRVNRVSRSHPRVVMVPYWVILAETSSPRVKSSRPRRVLKYRLEIRGSIYLLLSVGRKMIPFPGTVSDPKTILKKCRSVSKEGWTQVFIPEDHCFDCAVCPSTSPFALG